MQPLPRFRDPRLSLWQSSVANVLDKPAPGATTDAINANPMMRAASFAAMPYEGLAPTELPPATPKHSTPTATVDHCANLYLSLIYTTDPVAKAQIQEQISAYGDCDPRWAEAVAEYEKYAVVLKEKIPYIAPSEPDDSVIDGLPDRATIGFLADWGTGTTAANDLLQQLAGMRTPGVPFFLIHLGDIYYSGTQAEVARFISSCRNVLGADVPIFTLSGNHDMYAGGQPYYQAIGSLNASPWTQRTSFFNLRNAHWQFQAMDTGLNDRDPWTVDADTTFLDPAEVVWHQQQLAAAGDRKVVLLSHHQPFSAFCNIGGGHVNDQLLAILDGPGPKAVTLWLWGHEHNMIIYEAYMGISKGRCIGSGAIPVPVADQPYAVQDPTIPFNAEAILDNDGAVYSHGFAIMEIDGPNGKVQYFQSPDPKGRNPIYVDEF